MKFFLDFIRSRIITLVCIIIAAVIFAVVLSLYNLPSEPVLYALLLSLAAVTAIGAVTFIKAYRKHNILTRLANEITVSADNLPKAVSADDKDYGRLIRTLSDYCISLKEKSANSLQATNEYYTMWVHQIKTPISAMRLMLQSEDSESNRRLSDELMKIEQYVDMALCYVRLESSGNDLVIKHYSLDDIVKKSVRKFSTQRLGAKPNVALRNVSFSAAKGEYIAIMGESGSGKTTLLNILATLDKATAGVVMLSGVDITKIKDSDSALFRREHLGFVFQDFNLLDTFSVRDNIFLPLVLMGKSYDEMNSRLLPLAAKLGISDLLDRYPYEISGGQKQRTAVARALITNPDILLADEPTGALDSKASEELLNLFGEINRDGQTILMVTHSVKAASSASRVLFIKDGEVYHQIYKGISATEEFYAKINDTLTVLVAGGDRR